RRAAAGRCPVAWRSVGASFAIVVEHDPCTGSTPLRQGGKVSRSQRPLTGEAVATPASPGVPRREGRGYVTSYGTGRPCATRGCGTTLSRYNDGDRCNVHRGDGMR